MLWDWSGLFEKWFSIWFEGSKAGVSLVTLPSNEYISLCFAYYNLTLVEVMAWCREHRQAIRHQLRHCQLRSISPYSITGSRWVKHVEKFPVTYVCRIKNAKIVHSPLEVFWELAVIIHTKTPTCGQLIVKVYTLCFWKHIDICLRFIVIIRRHKLLKFTHVKSKYMLCVQTHQLTCLRETWQGMVPKALFIGTAYHVM